MRVLVTGASGFIGSRLTHRLVKDKHDVRILVRKTSNLRPVKDLKVEIAYGDLDDTGSLIKATKGTDYVFHCAALLGSPQITYKEIYNVNVIGTRNLLNACEKNKIKKFIHVSSVAALGDFKGIGNEEKKCNPKNPYEETKYLSELEVKKSKLNFVIVRPSIVYGPGEITNKAQMFKYIRNGLFRIIGDGNNMTSLVYIDDLVDGIVLTSKKSKAIGQTYIMSGEKPYPFKEFAYAIAEELNVKKPGKVPLTVANVAAFALGNLAKATKMKPILSKSRVNTMTLSKVYDISKAKKELGYRPKISLREGVKRTVDWYRKVRVIA